MIEIVRGVLLIYIFNKDLLLVQDWKVIRRLVDSDLGNIDKYQMLPFPDFDFDSNPFIITPGLKGLNIVNLQTGNMQRLLKLDMFTKQG